MNMSRGQMVVALGALASAAFPVAASAADYEGTYDSTSAGDGGGDHVLKLRQVGETITGTYDDGGGSIDGKLKGQRLDGKWHEGRDEGWLTFNFTADGKAFEGEWGYHGEKPNGKWIGKRRA